MRTTPWPAPHPPAAPRGTTSAARRAARRGSPCRERRAGPLGAREEDEDPCPLTRRPSKWEDLGYELKALRGAQARPRPPPSPGKGDVSEGVRVFRCSTLL
eukprot:scaffold2889_cov407-Prasinococcus_capsulatus_cf.AAC.5